ncbi:kinase-like protein [Gigaspora margarita]|uniref:Kinase-like protein n=1 Tax=Gigaspora margarita TaxID=4874 RepID=A0A8H4AC79_GIGMA|nr:kinase-like protein [Gigaspora margarita]
MYSFNSIFSNAWKRLCDNNGISYSEKNIQTLVDLITEQAYNTKIHDAKILQRIDIFFVKLGQSEAIKSLLTDYLDTESTAVWDWNLPISLVDRYRRDARYFKVMDSVEDFKMISQFIVEGLDQMLREEYIRAISYFYKALELETSWLMSVTFSTDFIFVYVDKLRRTNFIISYVKICLNILNDDALRRAKNNELFEQAIQDATFVLRTFVAFVKNISSDILFNKFLQEWMSIQASVNKIHEKMLSELIKKYFSVIESKDANGLNLPFEYLDHIIAVDNEKTLYERYDRLICKCKEVFKAYNPPDPLN